jgi:hypothetical protein
MPRSNGWSAMRLPAFHVVPASTNALAPKRPLLSGALIGRRTSIEATAELSPERCPAR